MSETTYETEINSMKGIILQNISQLSRQSDSIDPWCRGRTSSMAPIPNFTIGRPIGELYRSVGIQSEPIRLIASSARMLAYNKTNGQIDVVQSTNTEYAFDWILEVKRHGGKWLLSVSLHKQDANSGPRYLMAHPNGAVALSGNNNTWETFIMSGFENELTLQRSDNYKDNLDSGFLQASEFPFIQINCVDTRIAGAYHLLDEKTGRRVHYEGKLSIPTGKWAAQVWKHRTNAVWIYDHHEDTWGNHTWSVGPWSVSDGGRIFSGRYAYISTSVANYRTKEAEVGRKLESWEALELGMVANGWDTRNWPRGSKPGTITIEPGRTVTAYANKAQSTRFSVIPGVSTASTQTPACSIQWHNGIKSIYTHIYTKSKLLPIESTIYTKIVRRG